MEITPHKQWGIEMDIESLIRSKLASGKANGLCVSWDSKCGKQRIITTFGNEKRRDEFMAHYQKIGRNPRIEA